MTIPSNQNIFGPALGVLSSASDIKGFPSGPTVPYAPSANYFNTVYATAGATYGTDGLTVTFGSGATDRNAACMVPKTTGKWLFEAAVTTKPLGNNYGIGVRDVYSRVSPSTAIGNSSNDYAFLSNTGNKKNNNSSTSYSDSWDYPQRISILLNLDDKQIAFAVGGSYKGIAFTNIADGLYVPCVSDVNGQQPTWTVYSTPIFNFAGYKTWV